MNCNNETATATALSSSTLVEQVHNQAHRHSTRRGIITRDKSPSLEMEQSQLDRV